MSALPRGLNAKGFVSGPRGGGFTATRIVRPVALEPTPKPELAPARSPLGDALGSFLSPREFELAAGFGVVVDA